MAKSLIVIGSALLATGAAYADIVFEPTSVPGNVSFDTLYVAGTEYHQISVEDFPLPMDGVQNAGLPSVPYTAPTFLLPPDIQVDSIEIVSAGWDTLGGKYYLYPAQTGLLPDTSFAPPNPVVYDSADPFPQQPIDIVRQGSALGYSVVALSGTPVRYIPADSTVMVLSSITLSLQTGPAEYERLIPNRETEWSAAMRERGILGLVSNPGALIYYERPAIMSFEDRTTPLNITQSPSPEGDGVDMVIITNAALADDFEQVADYRTQQGIIAVVRTVEWIDQFYSGCDTPERMRNFIRDAHEEWGIQAVLLGGDANIVPVRECNEWEYITHGYPDCELPSDDYYADIDGDWSYDSDEWYASECDNYLDLCLGRWPVDDEADINLLFSKLDFYEQPDVIPRGYARELLLISTTSEWMEGLVDSLYSSQAIPKYLSSPTELYYPGNLNRNNALSAFDDGYGLIVHGDHSGIHEIGTAGQGTLEEFMWGSDFASMGNVDELSILWTWGCDPGHFDGADCFSEAGLLTQENTGLVAVISNSR